jgi:hypothetical protein
MKRISTVVKRRNEIFKEPKLTIGLDPGDRTSHYCILDEAGNVILEDNLPTTATSRRSVQNAIFIISTGRNGWSQNLPTRTQRYSNQWASRHLQERLAT